MQEVCSREEVVKKKTDSEGSFETHIKELENLHKRGEEVDQWLKEWGLIS